VILDITEVNKLELHVGAYALDCLYNADSIFLTNSIIGLRYVHKVNGKVFSTENDTYEELFSKYIVELKKSGNK
jgi:branched-subunit amino acid aminotransferase/4-amino-4-deoxychorismate lyase